MPSFENASSSHPNNRHHWQVMLGEVSIHLSQPYIHIQLKADERGFCALNKDNTINVAKVLNQLRDELWVLGGKKPSNPIRSLAQIQEANYQWPSVTGTLALGFNHKDEVIGMKMLDGTHSQLTLEQVVEVLQVLELFLAKKL